jgi:hypothetical protein
MTSPTEPKGRRKTDQLAITASVAEPLLRGAWLIDG